MSEHIGRKQTILGIFVLLFSLLFLMTNHTLAEEITFDLVQGFNGISLPFENTGITDAEGLCQSVPYCRSVSYWNAGNQEYITHDLGTAENNFLLTPGYPYFIQVTQNTSWTVSGDIPESVTFNLVTTASTDINAIVLSPYLSNITTAEQLISNIPNVDTAWYWDAGNMGYIGHPYGTEINNFPVYPYYPYFVNVMADTVWTVSVLKATVGALPTEGDVPLTVQFSVTATGGAPPYSYTWDIDGDGTNDYFVKDFNHTYQQAGVYTATLTIKDEADNTDTDSVVITVIQTNQNPVADPDGPYPGIVGKSVQFDGSGSYDPDGDPLTYTWNFGDGNSGSGVSPTHTYANVGTYTVTLTVEDGNGGTDTAQTSSEIVPPLPTITGFSPTEGTVGTKVTITGTNFDVGGLNVKFNGVNAIVTSFTESLITTYVPLGATTGPITVTTMGGSAVSTEPFSVLLRQDFELNVTPASVSIPSNGNASFVVTLTSTGIEEFTGLVRLSVDSVPGITVSFEPEYLSANQNAVLRVNATSLSTQTVLTISGTSLIDGTEKTKTAVVTLNPVPPGTTTLTGRVLATKDGKPIKGVTFTLGTISVISDEAGNFIFVDPPAGDQVIIVDGHTANTETANYPSMIPVPVVITGGLDNKLPYQVYLREVNTETYTDIDTTKDTVVTDPGIPDFQMLIPAGTVIMGYDGEPNERISVDPVPVDRLPIKPPPEGVYARTIFMYYFFKPGGGIPNRPVPVIMPNEAGALPGERVTLWYYDESFEPDPDSNQWKVFGMGTVSPDGKTIIPDPGVGIPKFCCGASFPQPPPEPPPPPPPDGCVEGCCVEGSGEGAGGDGSSNGPSGTAGDPCSLSTGIYISSVTDMRVPGRIPINIQRTYRTLDDAIGPFGRGSSSNWGDYLFIIPGNYQSLTMVSWAGAQYIFSLNPDGTYTTERTPHMEGIRIVRNPDGTLTEYGKDGIIKKYRIYGVTEGHIFQIVDRNGNIINLDLNSNGDPVKITDEHGRGFTITYSTFNMSLIASITDHTGRQVTYTYDTNSNLIAYTNPEGEVTRYTYDADNRLVSVINPRGITQLINEYNTDGRVIRQIHTDGGIYTYEYLIAGDTVAVGKVTDPNGNTTSYRFRNYYVQSVTDPYGQITYYDRDYATNFLMAVTDPLGRVTRYTYDQNGNRTSTVDPAGNTTIIEYDQVLNKPVKITDALGNVTNMSYDSNGNLISITDPSGSVTTISYDNYGQPISVKDALNNTSTFEYDDYGNLIKATDPLGNSATMKYDLQSRLIETTDAKGRTRGYTYDLMNRIIEVIDAINGLTTFSYDQNGNLLSVMDAKNQTISYTYNLRDRVETMTDQLGRVETYAYDMSDNLISVTDRKGQITNYTYDPMDRIERADYADGSYTEYFYDTLGRLNYISDPVSGQIEYIYSDDGCASCGGVPDRIIKEITPLGSISYEYDAIGRRVSMTVTGQPTVNYTYDANSRLTDINTLINGVAAGFNIQYDDLGRRTSLSLPNGVTTNYTYDSASNLLNIEHLDPLSSVLESISYVYDANSNRINMDRLNTPVELPDPASDITYNQANQMLTFTPNIDTAKSMTYDENGNMTSMTNGCGTTTYTWDARNRLTEIFGYDAQCSPLSASFKYDALGRRIEKTINGRTINYLYDGLDIVQEIEGGMVTVNYIRTLNIDEPLARIEADGTVRYYQTDALGSVIALTDETGNVKTTYNYDPFGNTSVSGEPSDNPFQYTGRENDNPVLSEVEGGLYYYRARYYSPELQRFISEDPIRLDSDDINFYAYVGNSPVNWVDPWGLIVIVSDNPSRGCPPGVICLDPGQVDPNNPGFFGQSSGPTNNFEGLCIIISKHLLDYLIGLPIKLQPAYINLECYPIDPIDPYDSCDDLGS